jgi:hypothetical protein
MKTVNQRHPPIPIRHEPSSSHRRDLSPRIQLEESNSQIPYDSSPSSRNRVTSRGSPVTPKYYGHPESQRSNKGYRHESASPRRVIGSGGEAYLMHPKSPARPRTRSTGRESSQEMYSGDKSPARPRTRSTEMYSGDYASHGQDTRPGYYRG